MLLASPVLIVSLTQNMALQVMHVGMQLLMSRQFSALLPVLRLAGNVSEEPALQFLKV